MITDNSPGKEIALTLKEAAAQLRCKDPRTVATYIKNGILRGSRIGKGYVIAQSAVDDLIRHGTGTIPGAAKKRGRPLKIAAICPAQPK
jgi:excisionase family DNA binding protein